MRKNRWICCLLACILVFCLTACGTEQTSVSETTAAAPATTEKATKDTAEKEAVAPAKETEVKETEAAAPAATETGKKTEVATETETEAASTDESPLVGEWSAMEMFVFKFNADGTGDYLIAGSSMPFTYEDHGDSVFVKFDEDTNGEEHGYRIDGNTLYFEDSMGEEVAYTRS